MLTKEQVNGLCQLYHWNGHSQSYPFKLPFEDNIPVSVYEKWYIHHQDKSIEWLRENIIIHNKPGPYLKSDHPNVMMIVPDVSPPKNMRIVNG